jgi:flagellar biosynthetic protein FliS
MTSLLSTRNARNEYLETKILTATPRQLHLIVVDQAIRHAAAAQSALEQGDLEKAHFALDDARKFISELIAGLDPRQSPEIVDNLRGLFAFAHRNLVEAELHRDAQRVEHALRILRLHRDTWLALCEKLGQDSAAQATGGASWAQGG